MKTLIMCLEAAAILAEFRKTSVQGLLRVPLTKDVGYISARGIIRDDKKKWLIGFALNKGSCSVLEVELWAILEGLTLAWRVGYIKVMVESDSQVAVLFMSNSTPPNHPLFSIIHACKILMGKEWSCTIHHIYKESNKDVDHLANLGHSLDLVTTVFEYPHPQIAANLEDDCKGVATGRLVSGS
ncbi:hypothetical protein Ddye_000305 [Dipteronia dyeriana]|uniref:RNase H type-1 domain-containing protein n=1 Tax=Dipteronia dyeriana TaxID=168575 RepID=A0AAD9XLX0_9ROSI|nr:hypothetical protein Ddye_000305 [Dipteronia dyeriana]